MVADLVLHTTESKNCGCGANPSPNQGFVGEIAASIPFNDLQSESPRHLQKRDEKGAKRMDAPKTGEFAHIGKSVVIKGELSGSEDLYVDGNVEGTIELRNHSLIVGPNGKVKATVTAKAVMIQGNVEGAITASDRVELKKTAVLNGDITTQRVAIEEGAAFRGKVDIQREAGKAASS
jgi:cytoskeletal protein CcmA (bactofilin family)